MCYGIERQKFLERNAPVALSCRVPSSVALRWLNMQIVWLYSELVFIICIVLMQRLLSTVIVKQLGATVVTTKYGKLRGSLVEFPQDALDPVEAYYGIQFASLRNNDLRFMPPSSPTEKWSSTRVFTDYKPACPQRHVKTKASSIMLPEGNIKWLARIANFTKTQTEDCLSLNLFVPTRGWNVTDKLPVMVFIHGESYEVGTGNAYEGSVLASYGGVIVITVNYRLGVLGFLSTGDANAEGNYALLDLLAMLAWVKENIEHFGGDTRRVTLFGYRHGAALVNLLLFTNDIDKMDGLVSNVILQSGSAYSSWATSIDPLSCARLIARSVNCSYADNNSAALVECLRERAVDDLIKSVPLTPKYLTCFAPGLGLDKLFTQVKSLDDLVGFQQFRFASIKMLVGLNENEAYSYLHQDEVDNGISENRKMQIIRTYVQNIYKYHKQKVYDILQHEYTQWKAPANKYSRRDDVMDLLSDGLYKAPLVKMAQEHSRTADTYFYSFHYSMQSDDCSQWSGVVHGDELLFVFGAPLVGGFSVLPSEFSNQEIELSKFVMRIWTNFAKTGDPNRPGMDRTNSISLGERWPKYNISTQSYLNISCSAPKVRNFYRAKEMALWLKLIPKMNTQDVNSSEASDQLENSENMSTFDDPSSLIGQFHSVFPNSSRPPYSLPFMPQHSKTADVVPQDTNKDSVPTAKPIGIEYFVTPNNNVEDPKEEHSMQRKDSNGEGVSTNVTLSVVIAIGSSVLFLNLIIFAGMYYQRKRIIRLKAHNNHSTDGNAMGHKVFHNIKDNERTPEAANMVQILESKPYQKVAALNHGAVINSAPVYQVTSKPTQQSQGPSDYTHNALSQTAQSEMHEQNQNQTTPFINTQPNRSPSEDAIHTHGSSAHVNTNSHVTDILTNEDSQSKSLARATHHMTSNNTVTIV